MCMECNVHLCTWGLTLFKVCAHLTFDQLWTNILGDSLCGGGGGDCSALPYLVLLLPQVTALFSELEGTCNSSLALYNATLEQIAESSSLGVVSREEARQLLARAQQQAALARQYRDVSRIMHTNSSIQA